MVLPHPAPCSSDGCRAAAKLPWQLWAAEAALAAAHLPAPPVMRQAALSAVGSHPVSGTKDRLVTQQAAVTIIDV